MEGNPGRGRHRVGGGLNHLRTNRPPMEGELSHGRMTRLQTQTEGKSILHGMTRSPERSGGPRESKPWDPPQRPDPERGRTDAGREEGTKTHPRPNLTDSSRPMAETEGRHGARRRWRTRRRRRSTAHPTGAALAAAAGGPVSRACAGRGGETNDAGYSPAHLTGTAPAAPVGGPLSVWPAPLIGATPRTEGGDETPRSMREEEETANEATEESPPPQTVARA